MKIIFAGTPQFAAQSLEALITRGHEISLVLTKPDRPAGRGMKLSVSAVKMLAQKYKITLLQPHSLKQPEIQEQLNNIGADIMVVAAYGLILPEIILNIPRFGCINIHASLLPRWRGAAPIQRAILAGEQETGITIMQMDRGLDTGDILFQQSISILNNDNTHTLFNKLTILGAECLIKTLDLIESKKITAIPQTNKGVSYASKLEKKEAVINWQLPAQEINYAIRALYPKPGAYSYIHGFPLKILQSKIIPNKGGNPGEILSVDTEGIIVACGKDSLVLEIIQKPGGKKLKASKFLAGHSFKPGDCFTSTE
ncbi:MAG: methionyl-tRNA formyltransferase [Nitrosomonadaceae bacterium]|mgnify:CR=1 FL=1|nr:methionyl-tRNA formyltransferase [Nitrosomonadaceae bacterium]|tara:strand:- start:929 stop:1864 length:936 start_codon:yes stop_codon:yes gene_type:complete